MRYSKKIYSSNHSLGRNIKNFPISKKVVRLIKRAIDSIFKHDYFYCKEQNREKVIRFENDSLTRDWLVNLIEARMVSLNIVLALEIFAPRIYKSSPKISRTHPQTYSKIYANFKFYSRRLKQYLPNINFYANTG